jgi:centriolar protein POC1
LGNSLATSISDGTLKILDLREKMQIHTSKAYRAHLYCFISKDGKLFTSGSAGAQVLIWRTNLNQLRYKDSKRNLKRLHFEASPHLLDIYPPSPHSHEDKRETTEVCKVAHWVKALATLRLT